MNEAVILVDSTSHAMRIENLLFRAGVPSKLIPVPRHLSSDCGSCVRISADAIPQVKMILEQNKVTFHSIEMI